MLVTTGISAVPAQASTGVPQAAFDRQVIALFNAERAARDLPPLREWPALRDVDSGALEWSQTMYQTRNERNPPYYHDWNHVQRGTANARCSGGSENVAWPGNQTPQGLVNLYMGSPVHRNQILSTSFQYVASGTVTGNGHMFNTIRFATTCTGFSDVGVDHEFAEPIMWLAGRGITTGYTDGSFRPRSSIQRQAVAAFLYRYTGATRNQAPNFSDVPPHHEFARHIEWAEWAGITSGYPDGTFRPEGNIERQAVAAFLYRLAGSPPVSLPPVSPFSDVPAGHEFYREIIWMAQNGITTGYTDGTFRPVDPVQRQAVAAFLYRYDRNVATSPLSAAD